MRTTVLLVASLLLFGQGLAMAADHGNAASWRTKADQELLEAYDAGTPTLKVELVGPRVAVPDGGFATRADAKAFYEAQTGAFRGLVRDLAQKGAGRVTAEVLYANAVFVEVPHGRLADIVARGEVRRAALDWIGATYVLGGAIDGPGVLVNLDASIAKNQASDMWALGFRGEGVTIAGIDTGIRPTHEMLKNADGSSRVTGWFDMTEPAGNRCATACDTHGHGTHTITTAAGSNLFNTGSQQGVAPRANIIGVRIFQGGGGSWEDAQEGLQGAFDLGADITTNSWGGGCSGGGITTAELAEDLQNLGMQNVFAAGNSGAGGVICPGMVDNVITVAAVDINEVVAGFSSRGPCVWPVGTGASRTCPDVSAVGVDLTAGGNGCDTCYLTMSGTSMATPHVAGVNVLLEQAWKSTHGGQSLNAAGKQAEIIMRYSAKDLGAGGPDNDYGWGLAKAKDAWNLANSGGGLNLGHLFSIGKPVLRAYETNNIVFSVVNLGGVAVDGTMSLDIRQTDTGQCPPTCDTTLRSKPASLGPFTESEVAYGFDGATHPAGNYLVNARLDYTYDGGSGMISETGTFLLKKVSFVKSRVAGASQHTGDLIIGGVTLTNVGNENASSVRYTERFRVDGFAPLPAVPPGVGQWGLFANPAPDNVRQGGTTQPTLTYEFTTIGTVNFGGGWTAAFNHVVGAPGSYPTTGTLRYNDEVNRAFSENFNLVTVVTPPV